LRHLILTASIPAVALLLAGPAAAQPPGRYAPPAPAAHRLPPPDVAERMGDRIGRVADALMDIDLAPLAEAIEPGASRRGPTSLGDLATRRDPYARERMHRDIEATSAGLGAAARDAAVMAPLVRQALARTMRDIDAAAREARARHGDLPPPPGYYDDGYRP
jgi:hypothetical protein